MCEGLVYNIENDLGTISDEITGESMRLATEEEARNAVATKSVSITGIPMITVVADGVWSKRLYCHSYNALSGCVSFIKLHNN